MPLLVNGEYVDDSLIRTEAQIVRQRAIEMNPELDGISLEMRIWEWARENVIDRVLLKQAALAATEPVRPEEIQALVRTIREEPPGKSGRVFLGSDEELRAVLDTELRTERFLVQLTAQVQRPHKSEVAEYYRRHRERFYSPEMVHVSHIVKNVDETTDEATALAGIHEAARAIAGGMPFAEAADRYSDCPGRGGDLGFFGRGEMVEEFETVVFGLREGGISPIFRSPFGFHIAKLHEKRPEGIRPLNEVRGDIERAILDERKNAIISRAVQQMRERADIRKTSAGK